MNNFGLIKRSFDSESSFPVSPDKEYDVRIIAGADVFKTLCPVNPNTNNRESLTSAIMGALRDPNKAALVSQVVQMLPAIASDSRLSDEDKLDMCFDRFDIGTRAENAQLYKELTPILQNALKAVSPSSEPSSSKIDFSSGDSPASAAE